MIKRKRRTLKITLYYLNGTSEEVISDTWKTIEELDSDFSGSLDDRPEGELIYKYTIEEVE